MIDPMYTMIHKVILHIVPSHAMYADSLWNEVISFLHAEITHIAALDVTLESFASGLAVSSADGSCALRTAFVPSDEDSRVSLWALRLRERDPYLNYRTKTTHIGIQQSSPHEIWMYIVVLNADSLGGRFVLPRPISREIPSFVYLLFRHPELQCISGQFALRSNAIMLIPQWIDHFLDLLYDGGRSLPVIMITCPDLISPGELQRQLLGNAIVCFCDDPNTIFMLNDRLPPSCSMPLDSIRTYLPFARDERRQPVHPIIALPDIQRLGSQEIYAAFRQAYCENLRASERSAFITVDTCRTVQMEREQAALCQQLVRADADLRGMKKDLSASQDRCQSLQDQLDALSEKHARTGVEEYEALLNECMEEADRTKHTLQNLVEQLYSAAPDFTPPQNAPAFIKDLYDALGFRARAFQR